MGVVLGIYVSQNYNIPDLHILGEKALTFAKTIEQTMRKKNN